MMGPKQTKMSTLFRSTRGVEAAREDKHNEDDLKRSMKPRLREASVSAEDESFSFFDQNLAGKVLSGFHRQWINDQFLDVTVTVGDVSTKAHKCVLAALSGYFEDLFTSSRSDDNLDVVHLQDISGDAVGLLIKYAYTGGVEKTPENVQDLLLAANYLGIEIVTESCPAGGACCSFFHQNLAGKVLSGFHRQWINDQFLDVTVTVGNVSTKARKCMLSTLSPYFEALFTSSMSDANLDVINLQDISGDAVELLIKYAYTGGVEITPENVQDLLFAANYLGIESIIDACCKYLVQNLSIENCIDIYELAGTLGQVRMKADAESFIILHFEELFQAGLLLRLNHETLIALLERDELILWENNFSLPPAEQEEMLVKIILHYVDEKPEDRLKHLKLLLSRGIRFLLLPRPKIESMRSFGRISSSPECLNLLNRILSSVMSNEECRRWERPRKFLAAYSGSMILANNDDVGQKATSRPFDDQQLFHEGQCFFIIGMKFHFRMWDGRNVIGGIKVFYNTGQSVLHGSKCYRNAARDEEFHLGPKERITEITAMTGWMIDRLQFKTNKGKVFGPYGGDGGGRSTFRIPRDDAYLACIAGTVDITQGETAVRRLRFIWGFPKHSGTKRSKLNHTPKVLCRADLGL